MIRLSHLVALLSLALFALAGCSDLGKKDVVKNPLESSRFSVDCKLKASEFEDILERDITPQISCLQKSIDLFIRVVKGPRPGYLSRVAFEQYVTNELPPEEFDPENVKAIKAVFDIAHLIFGDARDFLSPASVKKIFDFVYVFNREAPRVYPLFKSREENTPYQVHKLDRVRVQRAFDIISRALTDIHVDESRRRQPTQRLNILELLEPFTNQDTQDVMDKVKALLFIKRVIVGGTKEELTHTELRNAFAKVRDIGSLVFDLLRVKYIDFKPPGETVSEQKNLLEFIDGDIKALKRLLYYNAGASVRLFTIDDLIDAIPYFINEEDSNWPDFKKYRPEVLQAKMLLMTNERWSARENLNGRDWFYPGELITLVSHAEDIIQRGLAYHSIYTFFRPSLDSPGPVNINYSNYTMQFPGQSRYVEEFARIASRYRYFYGEFEMPYYSSAHRRNLEGMVEQGVLEYVFTIVSRRFGEVARGAVGGWGLTQEQLYRLIKTFNRLLVDEGLITKGREVSTTQNITLLTTLFQSMSNGDGVINVDEASAFFTQVFASMAHAEWFQDEMAKRCETDVHGRITDLACHREHYFSLLCEKFKDQFPVLFKALGMTTTQRGVDVVDCSLRGDKSLQADYIKSIELVGRTCTTFESDGADVPMSDDDYMPVLVMLQTIEGSILRYDSNKNNKLDPSEVRTAYDATFKVAIEALVEEQAPIIGRLPFNLGGVISRKIFYYLIKNKAIPSRFNEYLKLLTIKATSAHRDTFAAVLKIINDQSKTQNVPGENAPAPPFNCETLRHPPAEEESEAGPGASSDSF